MNPKRCARTELTVCLILFRKACAGWISGLGFREAALHRIVLLVLAHATLAISAFATCSAPKNAIEAENCLPGNPTSQWYVSGTGSTNIGIFNRQQCQRGEDRLFQDFNNRGRL